MSKKEKSKEVLKGLKELSVKDLQVKSAKLKDDIFWLQFKNRSGQTISVGDLQKNKKMLAQVVASAPASVGLMKIIFRGYGVWMTMVIQKKMHWKNY